MNRHQSITKTYELLQKYGYYEWIAHSYFSFLKACSSPQELIKRAIQLNYHGLALCDYDGVYGLARAYRAWKKNTTTNHHFKLIYGAEIHLENDHFLPLCEQNTLILLAQSHTGYKNLCQILTLSHKEGKHNAWISLHNLCHSNTTDLVALFPMRGLLRTQQYEKFIQQYKKIKEAFFNKVYLGIGRFFTPLEDSVINRALTLSQQFSIPCLVNQDAFFAHYEQKPLHDIIQSIRLQRPLSDITPHLWPNGEHSLSSLKDLAIKFHQLPHLEKHLENSCLLAQSIHFSFSSLRYNYPKEMIPQGFDAHSYLEYLVYRNAQNIYGYPLPHKIKNLLKKELSLIKTLGFADYFLTVWDIVSWARKKGILCQGRGSAANSAVCFILGITSVNPLYFDLLFERFLSVERGDPPDIDVDFEHERREEVIQYIYQRYGRTHAAMVANVICFKKRSAMREAGKALGIPSRYIEQASLILKDRSYRHDSLHKTLKIIKKDFSQHNLSHWEPLFNLWAHLSDKLEGMPRHLGIHTGGFIVSDRDLSYLVATEPATLEHRSVIQWCKEDIEALGFFKIDILALGMLTAIRKAFELIKSHYHKDLTLHNLSLDDEETYRLIQKADTVGVFQIESRAQMQMLAQLLPRTFYDLVIQVAIIRPGPIQGGLIHPFLKRREGKEPIQYAHPDLIPILKRTLGVPLFQEQVMRIAMTLGNFTPGEADELRKHMGAWQLKGDLSPYISKLILGMKRKKIAPYFINQLVNQLKGFAEYGFPESHAASFAFLAYASSYLKTHYPACFYTALLNSQPMGFYSPSLLIEDAKRHHIKVHDVCILNSSWDSTLEFDKQHQSLSIRLGLRLIHGLSYKSYEKIIAARKKMPPTSSLTQFLSCLNLDTKQLCYLASAHAFSVFNVDRLTVLWLIEAMPLAPLFEEPSDHEGSFKKLSSLEQVQVDYQTKGFSLSEHPSLLIKNSKNWPYSCHKNLLTSANQLANKPPLSHVYVFGLAVIRQSPPTAKGMLFITLEDEGGFINLVVNPSLAKTYQHIIYHQSFLCAYGQLQKEKNSISIYVKKFFDPHKHKIKILPLNKKQPDYLKAQTAF